MSLRNLEHREVVRILTKHFDFYVTRQSGSHFMLRHSTDGRRRTTVPRQDPIKLGTLRGILLQAGVPEDEFLKYV